MFARGFGWKALYYGPFLHFLKCLSPRAADATNRWLGRLWGLLRTPQRARLDRAYANAATVLAVLGSAQNPRRDELADQSVRMLARDCLIKPNQAETRFLVKGFEQVAKLRDSHRPAILLGCHLGAYIPSLQWMYRQGLPLRLLVQCPNHVSPFLRTRFSVADEPFPQTRMFVRRGMTPQEAAERMLRARAALRGGMMMYLCGDIPWPKGRETQFLGRRRPVQSVWLDLAMETGAPVIPVFATFNREGVHELDFDAPIPVTAGSPQESLDHYFERLHKLVLRRPEQAWPYWAWPTYQPSVSHSSL